MCQLGLFRLEEEKDGRERKRDEGTGVRGFGYELGRAGKRVWWGICSRSQGAA
jgi:hypothetical protein